MACWMTMVSSSGTLTKIAVPIGRGTLDGLIKLDGLGITIIIKSPLFRRTDSTSWSWASTLEILVIYGRVE